MGLGVGVRVDVRVGVAARLYIHTYIGGRVLCSAVLCCAADGDRWLLLTMLLLRTPPHPQVVNALIGLVATSPPTSPAISPARCFLLSGDIPLHSQKRACGAFAYLASLL